MGSIGPLPPRERLARRPRRTIAVTLRRQPILFWALTALGAAASYWAVSEALAVADRGAVAYGDLTLVVVAERTLEPGEVVGPDDVRVQEVPESLVPSGALTSVPTGRSVRATVVAGEAVVASRLAPDGAVGVAAALRPGERALAIPVERNRAPLQVGQSVDVLATVDPTLAAGRNPTTAVSEAARVLDVAEDVATIAVPLEDAERVATALATAVVTVAVRPG